VETDIVGRDLYTVRLNSLGSRTRSLLRLVTTDGCDHPTARNIKSSHSHSQNQPLGSKPDQYPLTRPLDHLAPLGILVSVEMDMRINQLPSSTPIPAGCGKSYLRYDAFSNQAGTLHENLVLSHGRRIGLPSSIFSPWPGGDKREGAGCEAFFRSLLGDTRCVRAHPLISAARDA
jgi:hypothetical protein